MKFPTLIFSLACIAAGLSGCGRPSEPTIRLGLNVELSGEMPSVGASSKNGAQLYVDKINEAGGLEVGGVKYKIELASRDNGAKADQAAAIAQRLISQENVLMMIGPNSSACAIPAAEIAESLQCVMIAPWSTNPKTTQNVTTGKPKEYVFRGCFTDVFQAEALAKFARNDLKISRAAILYDVASEAPNGQANLFKTTFERFGGKVTALETYTTGDRDFSAQLTKIRASEPEVLFLPAYYNDVPLVAQQARRQGITIPFLGSDAWSSPEIIKLGGQDLAGSYFCNHYSTEIGLPEAKAFVEAYTAKFGQAPNDLAALAYDSLGLACESIRSARKLDRKAVRDALSKIPKYEGVTGLFHFDEGNPDPVKSACILQIKDGKFSWVANVNP